MVATDALMLSLMIDAFEKRDVTTANVVGAYLNAKMLDFILLRLVGETVDIMCHVNPRYAAFVVIEGGKKVLYLRLLKALYGCAVKSALLWYELFTGTLQGMGFELNPYDPCVVNKTINDKQCSVVWYMDDNKILHVDPQIVSQIVDAIEQHFGKMTMVRGKKHIFLGMEIDFNDDGTVKIGMKSYIEDAIKCFAEDVTKGVTTPAQKDVFEVDFTSVKLNQHRSNLFHTVVAKLLYVSKRGRPNIQLAMAFLCTRVSVSTEQDWSKLKRVLQYLHRTLDEFLVIGADSLTVMKTWVDAAYGVHSDLKSHTGGVISMGRGTIMCKSTKQKLNTKSSTEAELVGATDYLPNTIWARMFLKAQGYGLEENVFFRTTKVQ